MRHDPGLVVGGATTVEPALPNRGLERRGLPQRLVTDGLDVVMGVQQDGRATVPRCTCREHGRLPELLRAGNRCPLDGHGIEHSRAFDQGSHCLCAAYELLLIHRWPGDRGNPHQIAQIRQRTGDAGLGGVTDSIGTGGDITHAGNLKDYP